MAAINSQITIPQSQPYAVATFNSTYKPGTATITAAATNLLISQQTITTNGFTPSKLAVFCVPSTLPSDNATYQAIQVQLQDSQGRPAKNPTGDVIINLFSSQPTVGIVSSTLTIPFGQTQTTGSFTVTNAPGTTSITAQASGYTTGQASVTTYLIDFTPLQITLTPTPANVGNGNNATIGAYVTGNGVPVTGAKITFTSNNGGTFTPTTEQGNGYYNTTFTALSFSKTTTCTITASGSKTGYLSAQGTTQITVTPAITATPTPTSTPTPTINAGTITLLIEDNTGNKLSNTIVSSTTQPTGMPTLSEITNATGYVTFQNATAGLYTFKIIKEGYLQMNQTINYTAQPLLTITLYKSNAKSNNSGTPLITLTVVIIVIVIAAIGSLYLIRRKRSATL